MFGEYINNLIDNIKKTYNFIYENYNYKQIILIFAVFVTIYIVELLNSHNANILPLLPIPTSPIGPPGLQKNNIQVLSKEIITMKKTKTNKRVNKVKNKK